MSEEAMQEVLDSLAKIGKQWDLGEPVGRIWGFLLFKACPVTQREIEEGTGYSRGLISRCLKIMEKMPLIEVSRVGKENLYSVNTSLTDGFSDLLKRFLTDKIDPMIDLLSETVDKVQDAKVREIILALLHEYKKLHLAIRIFFGIIEDINVNAVAADMEEAEDYIVTVNIEDRVEYAQKIDNKGGNKDGNE